MKDMCSITVNIFEVVVNIIIMNTEKVDIFRDFLMKKHLMSSVCPRDVKVRKHAIVKLFLL